jgi:hypothetical protein
MYTADTHTTAPKVRSSKAECCDELACQSGLRNKYYDGKRLTTESFLVERDFLQERRLLINRAVHGWGVVYGYPVAWADGLVSIGSGLAFDKCGRELLQVGEQKIELADLLVLEKNGRLAPDRDRAFAAAQETRSQSGQSPARACWLLSVHYAERDEGSVRINDPCSCERQEWDRICETVRYSLRHVPCVECCADFECELTCECGAGHCCGELYTTKAEQGHPRAGERVQRGGCRCLCDHLAGLSFEDCGHHLCDVPGTCGSMRVDLKNGVALACVTLARDGCDDLRIGQVLDACGPRRLVKRNDLLFDLIRGCDVTRISEIGWAEWHRRQTPPVPFEEFADALGHKGERQDAYVTNRFWLRFSRPVREKTLLPDCVAMTVMSFEREGGWLEVRRVPIVRIDGKSHPGDPAGHVSEARVVVDGRWFEDAVWGSRTLFYGGDTWVEIEVRGDFIVDCNGQTVDANAIGLSPAPTGNGTPGGTFVSTFRVEEEREPTRSSTYDSSQRVKGASS